MAYQTGKADADTVPQSQGKPAWLAPLLIVLVIVALFAGSRKRGEVVENPLVELAVLTVGVFAMAAALAVVASKLGSPGIAAFFGRPYTHQDHANAGSNSA